MRRHRLSAAVLSAALLIGLVPVAAADDPADDKARVESEIAKVQGELVESTAAVAAAARALAEVDAQLASAQEALATARGDLVVATAEDARLADELAGAEDEERAAEAALVEAQEGIEAQQAAMGSLARAAYQGSSFDQVNALFDAESLTDLSQRVEGVQTVLRAQGATLAELADHRADLAEGQATLEAVRERVATAREQAAANLIDKARLEKAAIGAEAQVAALRGQRAEVLASAQQAQAADEAEYAALQAEREELEAELRRRAEAEAAAGTQTLAPLPPASGILYQPVVGRVTSSYGMRVHPITGIYKLHDGTDFGASCGTVIRAAASGTVLRRSYAGGYGNQTVIEHGLVGGAHLATSYNHQSRFAVSVGQHVERGQVIGYVGTTGYSTGCHLHFMVYVNGSTTDPMRYL